MGMTQTDIYVAVQQFIAAHYAQPITLAEFASFCGVSRADATAAISLHSKSWARMLLDERMKHAKELLSYSGESIEVIASRVGYEPSQFVRTFKAETGEEPEQYRQQKQQVRLAPASPRNGSASS
jgi:AraC-like DNA-binding protein